MKVCFLATSNSRSSGGLYYTIQNMLKQLYQRGIDVSLLSCDDKYSFEDCKAYGNVPLIKYNVVDYPVIRSLGFSFDLKKCLNSINPQIIHQQGIWMYHSYAALKYKEINSKVVKIVETHGMLDPWAVKNSAWKKKIVSFLYENKNLSSSDCIHALCQSEYESIRLFGLKNPVAIIPNGIELPCNITLKRNNEKRILLYIGRIHPKKGLKEMILGLARLKHISLNFFDDWCVRIAGWDQNGHINELQELVEKNHLSHNVSFIGAIYGDEKKEELCRANAFILPSFSEGLPMSILEAWSYQLPVIMTDYCNLQEGFDANAAYHIEPNPESICNGLLNFNKKSINEIEAMGKNGLDLVLERFTWQHIAEQTIELYNYLLGEGEKPEFVYE